MRPRCAAGRIVDKAVRPRAAAARRARLRHEGRRGRRVRHPHPALVWHSPALGYTAARSRRAASSAGPSRQPGTTTSHRGARRLRHPAGPSGHGLASRRTAPAADAIRRTAIVRGSGRSRPETPRRPRRAGDHHLPGAGWAVTTCEQASSRPQAPGAYWGHGPDHRDNPRRDPRHMACRRGCGRDRCNAQDVSPHRADRDGRLHRRVARGQAPSPQLARRSRRGQRDRNTVLRTSSGPDRTDRSATERRTTCARFEVRGVLAPLGGVRQSAHAGTT
jgi:hypothetical protein